MNESEGHPAGGLGTVEAPLVDPRAVRATVATANPSEGPDAIVVEPPGSGLPVRVDGRAGLVRLDRLDAVHAVLVEGDGDDPGRTPVMLMPIERPPGASRGVDCREVVVDGWRVEVEVEAERRASLRERARRGHAQTASGGPTEVRAIIPGRIISVSIAPGDPVEAGQQLLVVEAMKMQNELRAPRDGLVSRVAVAVGGTIEVGDLLLVLE